MENLMPTHFLIKHRKTIAIASAVTIALILNGCATVPKPAAAAPTAPVITMLPVFDTAQQTALKARMTLQDRLYRIAAPLLVRNPELCRATARKLLGFTAKNKHSFTPEFADAAERSFGLDERLQVMGVLADGGAEKAGLRPGDLLLAVEGKAMPEGQNAERIAAGILGPIIGNKSNVQLTIMRGTAIMDINVPLTLACAFGIELGNSDNVNAYSDGHRVMITRGMMNFARSDTQLAYVIAREMAHSALGHANRLRMSATLGSIIDNLIRVHPDLTTMGGMAGVKPFPQDVDAAADTLSLYMLARAGYDIEDASGFWQRLAAEYPASTLNGYTAIHPSTIYRMKVMAKILPIVKTKLMNRSRLSP